MKTTLLLAGVLATGTIAAQAQPEVLGGLPIREATVFKDGHSLVIHEGEMQTNADGDVTLRYLPEPLRGTFWAFENSGDASIVKVTAGYDVKESERQLVDPEAILRANVGKTATISYHAYDGPHSFRGKVLGLSNLRDGVVKVALDSGDSKAFIPTNSIHTIQSKEFEYSAPGSRREERLLLNLDWNGAPEKDVSVGVGYVQAGLRWMPNYHVRLDEEGGTAELLLQATLVNDLADLKATELKLAVGAPSFAFENEIDPISLAQNLVRGKPARGATMSQVTMSNVASGSPFGAGADPFAARRAAAPPAPSPDLIGDGETADDLFLFTVKDITLDRGERMTASVVQADVEWEELFRLELLFVPPSPPSLSGGFGRAPAQFGKAQQSMAQQGPFGSNAKRNLAEAVEVPSPVRVLRLHNTTEQPFTTAPALVFREETILAQGLMTYAAPGGSVDINLNKAVAIVADLSSLETQRDYTAADKMGDVKAAEDYALATMRDQIEVTNRRGGAVTLEVSRTVAGFIDEQDFTAQISGEGVTVKEVRTVANAFQSEGRRERLGLPHWWYNANTTTTYVALIEVENDAEATLEFDWYYFWRK